MVATTKPGVLYSDRIGRLREKLISAPYEADLERARYYTRSYKETEGQGACMRAARGLEETLRNMTISIDGDELLVGAKSAKTVASPIGIERSSISRAVFIGIPFHGKTVNDIKFVENLEAISAEWVKALLDMPDEEVAELRDEILPYWRGKDAHAHMIMEWIKEGLVTEADPRPHVAAVGDMQGHVTVGTKKVLDMGFKGIGRQAAEQLAKLHEGDENYEQRKDFLESVQVVTNAVCEFSERYAHLAEELAERADGRRKAELLEIADRCRRVPANPPTSFKDAVQAVWTTQVTTAVSYGEDAIFAPGRVDQYLYPYYEKDKKAGLIDRERAKEILDEYFIKISTFTGFGPNNITIGGMKRNGEDGTNEISYLMLDSLTRLKGLRYGLAVRISDKTPRDFLLTACATHRRTAGVAFYNDARVINDLMTDGYALEDARDYSVVGCVELTSSGNNNGYTSGSVAHFVRPLEMALNEGRARTSPHTFLFMQKDAGVNSVPDWEDIGIKTPPASTFKTFQDVKKAYADQLANSVAVMCKLTDAKDKVFAESFPTPLLSCTIEGCVESGRDNTQGGARYNHASVSCQGIATVANSLAAIEWAVFDEKLLTMEELVNHLNNNFEGAEELRQQLIHKAPKYGNDDPKADAIALWLTETLNKEARKHRRALDGGPYRALLISAGGSQVGEGQTMGATPDGRLRGEAVSNGMSSANGTEVKGMTAMLHSAAKVSAPPLSSGTSVNMNLNPLTIRTDEGVEKLASLLEGYFALGGRQVQFNPMSRETLLDAQEHPENYPDMMVKVSGYSYRFVDLSRSIQNDIIARTEFEV
jgi:pyruvate formate-lyase/glycerol dehydratase family glycyl radical enzyme